MNNSKRITELKEQKKLLEASIKDMPHVKPQFLITDDDEYQDTLEIGWAIDELNDQLNRVNEELYKLLTGESFELHGDMALQFNESQNDEDDLWQ